MSPATQEPGVRVDGHVTVYRDPRFDCGPGPAAARDPHTGRLTAALPSGRSRRHGVPGGGPEATRRAPRCTAGRRPSEVGA